MEAPHATLELSGDLARDGTPGEVQDFLTDPVGCMRRLHRDHGLAVRFRKGEGGGLFVFGPEYNRQIFVNPDTLHIVSRFPGPKNSAQRRFGRGLFSMNGAEHQEHRRMLMPVFAKEHLVSYHDSLCALARETVESWPEGQVVDLWAEMKEFTLRITMRLLFGVDDLGLGHTIEGLFEEWLDLNHVVSFGSMLPVEAPPDAYQQLLDVAERLETRLQELVQLRRGAGERRKDLLGLLTAAQDGGAITGVEVIGQTITLFNAAYHTTTAALSWSLFLLAQHPDVLRRLDRELRITLGGSAPTPEQLAQLPLLERCVKESMRLLPPVVYLPRITTRAVDMGPYRLSPQTMVLASPYVTHRIPDVYPRPQCFEPDRWLRMGPCSTSYVPFGGGARLCLGAPFAMMVLKITLAVVLQRRRLRVVPGARIDRQGTLSLGARYGIPVTVLRPDGEVAVSPVIGNIHEMVELPYTEAPARAA